MTEPDRTLERRVADLAHALDRRRTSDGFARLYGPLAILCVMLPFLPIYGDVPAPAGSGADATTFGTLWELASNGGPEVGGLVLLAVLVLLLTVATSRSESIGLPGGIAVFAALVVLMLLSTIGTGTYSPPLTNFGHAGVAVASYLVLLAGWHAGMLAADQRRAERVAESVAEAQATSRHQPSGESDVDTSSG